MNLRLNWYFTFLFSFLYFQFALNKISKLKETSQEAVVAQPQDSVTA
jgi:hypothetical protein